MRGAVKGCALPACPPTRTMSTSMAGGRDGATGWVGTGNLPGGSKPKKLKSCLPFGEALAVARLLGLGNQNEWMAWSKSGARPASMPSSPDQAYTHDGWEGWEGWGRWLGTGNLRTKQFLSFAEALVVARSLGFPWQVRVVGVVQELDVPFQRALPPTHGLQARRVGGLGPVARDRQHQSWHGACPPAQRGAGRGACPRAGQPTGVGSVGQGRDAPSQRALSPRPGLHTRRVAGVGPPTGWGAATSASPPAPRSLPP